MLRRLRKLWISEDGATAVEYGLIISLVVLGAMGAIAGTAQKTIGMWAPPLTVGFDLTALMFAFHAPDRCIGT